MGCMGREQHYPCKGSARWWALATTSSLGTSPHCWKDWESVTAPTTISALPRKKQAQPVTGMPRGILLPPHAKSRNDLSLKRPRQVLSQAYALKGLCNFLKVCLAFLTSRKSKKLYLSLDLIVCQQQPSLPSIISSTYTQYWIRLFSYRKVNACKISLRIRPSPWQTEAFLQEAAAAAV